MISIPPTAFDLNSARTSTVKITVEAHSHNAALTGFRLAMLYFTYPEGWRSMNAQSLACIGGGNAARLDPLGMEPGRLWSLWDMFRINAGPFVHALADMAIITATLDNIRQKDLQTTSKVILGHGMVLMMLSKIEILIQQLVELNAHVTKASALRLAERLQRILQASPDGTADFEDVLNLTFQSREIVARIGDELGAQFVFSISPSQADFFAQGPAAFGSDVEAKFPSATYDIDEAAKCEVVPVLWTGG